MARAILTDEELHDLLGESPEEHPSAPPQETGDAGSTRRFERHPCRLAAELIFHGRHFKARLQDIGFGGAALETSEDVPVDEDGVLSLSLPGADEHLEAAIHVRWNEITPGHWSRLGISFDKLTPAEFVALMEFLNKNP